MQSAGLLLFRRSNEQIEVLLAHPGGPYWRDKDAGAWTIPKGEFGSDKPLEAARREFVEETNLPAAGPFIPLGTIRQKAGKLVHVWATEGNPDLNLFRSNSFLLEWPPRSGRSETFPEVDRVRFFTIDDARRKINAAQAVLLDRLSALLCESGNGWSPLNPWHSAMGREPQRP